MDYEEKMMEVYDMIEAFVIEEFGCVQGHIPDKIELLIGELADEIVTDLIASEADYLYDMEKENKLEE